MNQHIFRKTINRVGIIVLALGIILNTQANLGVPPILSVPYVLSRVWNMNFGDVTLFWHAFLIFWEVVIHCIRKKRKVLFSDIIQLPLSFVLTRFMKLFARIIPVFYGPMRFLILAMGILLTGIGTAMYFNSDLGLLADDGFTEAIADLIHKNVLKTKIIFEVCCVIIAVIISLSCLHTVIGVGIGTICIMPGVRLVTKLYNRILKEKTDTMSGLD